MVISRNLISLSSASHYFQSLISRVKAADNTTLNCFRVRKANCSRRRSLIENKGRGGRIVKWEAVSIGQAFDFNMKPANTSKVAHRPVRSTSLWIKSSKAWGGFSPEVLSFICTCFRSASRSSMVLGLAISIWYVSRDSLALEGSQLNSWKVGSMEGRAHKQPTDLHRVYHIPGSYSTWACLI